jgi:hypothetical protein
MEESQSQSQAYFNFIESLDSDKTKRMYEYCIKKFLNHYKTNLESLLKLPPQDISNMLIKYIISQKLSRQYKVTIFYTIKKACEMNDVILNWKKITNYIKSKKTGNEIAGRDRGYTHEEIQKIISMSDQRVKTAFHQTSFFHFYPILA